jgi:hypothetical protein
VELAGADPEFPGDRVGRVSFGKQSGEASFLAVKVGVGDGGF